MKDKEYLNKDIPDHLRKAMSIPDDDEYSLHWYPSAGVISVFKNGKLHNDNGPAVYSAVTGTLSFYKNGFIHRKKGPAVICSPKETISFYWGNQLMNSEYLKRDQAQELINAIMGKEIQTERSYFGRPDQY